MSEFDGAPGEVVATSGAGFTVACGEGALLVGRVRPHDGGKISAADYLSAAELSVGTRLGA
jgi:methionyl-tRNA formyltransferase